MGGKLYFDTVVDRLGLPGVVAIYDQARLRPTAVAIQMALQTEKISAEPCFF